MKIQLFPSKKKEKKTKIANISSGNITKMLKLAFGLFILGCMASSLNAGIIPTSDGDEIKDWERYKDMICKI